ncbi:1-deoxy-D-xylulose-5-phosphate synthase [Actinomadura alba]|uniref:1-deoxy-D-xylulose-5-phosphate synthase n=1 Tax=Actinomadura alba TaxID=406431 RepID=A0ABR7LVI4_9ACTN|nr:1-deoxy-D-xylulose-5-phosphate synthase [Actinomadura alba]MBC6468433.1 1-deoxy-D-xylulose-5-phosphate synthase [Actinomadura alba]
MGLLDTIDGPRDLDGLTTQELVRLSREIRDFLIEKVARTGGHLGPNLGAVELTLALHRVFDSPRDRILWDTGHQAYVHKILTGRRAGFDRLRQKNGLSGYPSAAESEHDIIENSHASTALSYADGLAKADELRGVRDRAVVAVIGDGALTGGMAWEALNNIAAAPDRPVVIVINDNGRSYSPTIGGLASHLAALRTTRGYEKFLASAKETLTTTPVVGPALYSALHGAKKGLKDIIAPQGMFEDLGLKYVGPIDGHDIEAMENALRMARDFGGPVAVHCLTTKGRGYRPAEDDRVDHFHAVRVIDPATGRPSRPAGRSWTSVFASELVEIGEARPDVVAITAAMLHPTGLEKFQQAFPDRVFDVGIAEQHAVTSAAGLAMGGTHPVVAIYSTFLNRAFDQLVMDVALHRCGVTLVLDRAGVTGDDGASHNGMWDLSILQVVPGLRICAPRDADTLRAGLREAVAVEDAPTLLRFPKGEIGPPVPAVDTVEGMDVLSRGTTEDVLVVAVGAMARECVELAGLLEAQGIGATVVDPRWVMPVNEAIPRLAGRHRLVVTVEDSGRAGGVGSAVAQALQAADVATPVRSFGIPPHFLEHGKRADILKDCGLTAHQLFLAVIERTTVPEDITPYEEDARPAAVRANRKVNR